MFLFISIFMLKCYTFDMKDKMKTHQIITDGNINSKDVNINRIW